MSDQSSEDEEDHEETTKHRRAEDVTVADCRHRHQREVNTLPVCQPLNILEVVERVARVFHLRRTPQRTVVDVSTIDSRIELRLDLRNLDPDL